MRPCEPQERSTGQATPQNLARSSGEEASLLLITQIVKKKKKGQYFFFFTYCSSFDLRAMVYIVPSCKFLTGVIISSSPSRFQMQTLPDAALGSSVRSQELD